MELEIIGTRGGTNHFVHLDFARGTVSPTTDATVRALGLLGRTEEEHDLLRDLEATLRETEGLPLQWWQWQMVPLEAA